MRSPAKNLFLTLLGAAAGALAGELLLGWLGLPAFPEAKVLEHTGGLVLYRSRDSGYPLHRLVPHSTYTHLYGSNPRSYFDARNGITIAANGSGFRGRDADAARDRDKLRIVFLGDSITLGEGVKLEDTYPELIAARLDARPGGPPPVVSYNFGMLAYNTVQEHLILLEEALSARPDLIVLGYFLNDMDGPFAQEDPRTGTVLESGFNPFAAGMADRPPPGPLFALRSTRLLWQLLQRRQVTERTLDYFRGLYDESNRHLARNRESLQAIIRLCAAKDIPLVIACIPLLYKLDAGYPLARIHRQVEELVRSEASGTTTFIDLLPHFQGMDARELWVHATDHHPNERAHRIIAEALLDHVGQNLPRGQARRQEGPGRLPAVTRRDDPVHPRRAGIPAAAEGDTAQGRP